MVEGETLLSVRDVYKTFGEAVKTEVLHGVSLEVERGDFLSIMGPSGSGKSTLLNLLGALDGPSSGEIFFRGESVNGMNAARLAEFRNRNLGFVFQFHHLLPEFTALENVLMPRWIKEGRDDPEAREKAEELIATVGIRDQQNKMVNQLSGGQKQRVAVARSLMNDPALLLADEPTGNLDTEISRQVYELMRKINEERGTVFIIVTHDRNLASLTDRIIKLVDGEIVSDSSK
ncbi:MAG: ABC transporter ATP-binding protein [Bacillota bacterium]